MDDQLCIEATCDWGDQLNWGINWLQFVCILGLNLVWALISVAYTSVCCAWAASWAVYRSLTSLYCVILVWLFSTVCFQICVLWVAFVHCLFSNMCTVCGILSGAWESDLGPQATSCLSHESQPGGKSLIKSFLVSQHFHHLSTTQQESLHQC